MEGLELAGTSFDFHKAEGLSSGHRKRISWKLVVALLAAGLLAGVFFWASIAQQKLRVLRGLEAELAQGAPYRQEMLRAERNWRLFGSYVGRANGGWRAEYLKILGEISELFPDTNDGYMTDVVISTERTGQGSSDVSISGKVSRADVVIDFFDRLGGSEMFGEAKRGPLTQDASDSYYPVRFSVTCNLSRLAEGAIQ